MGWFNSTFAENCHVRKTRKEIKYVFKSFVLQENISSYMVDEAASLLASAIVFFNISHVISIEPNIP